MSRKKEYILWILLIGALLLGSLWQFYPLPTAEQRLDKLPMQGANFQGIVVPLIGAEEEIFKEVNVVKRIYDVEGQNIFIYMLDGTHDRHPIHDPTYCFRGAGWTIDSSTPFPLQKGEGMLYTISKGEQKKEALLWFTDGSHFYYSPWIYWWETTLRRLSLGASGEEPVLIVIQPLDTSKVNWEKLMQQFPELESI